MWEQDQVLGGLKKLLGDRVLCGVWEVPHASHLPAQKSDAPSLQKAGPGGPLLLGSQENSQIMPGWHQDGGATPPRRGMGRFTVARSFLKSRHMVP